MPLSVGITGPDFTLRNQRREKVSLDDLKGSRSMIVFIPFAFTATCQGELCEIRDNIAMFQAADAKVVAITCNTIHSNGVWAEQQGFNFDLLSDFWPHGGVARAYDVFSDDFGYAKRTTYLLDENAVITDVITSDELGVARRFAEYTTALSD